MKCSSCDKAKADEPNGFVRGMCRKCYQRWKKHGTTELPTATDRFWSKVEKTDDCWHWTGYRNPAGYGQFGDGGKVYLAHRWIVENERGAIPEGMTIDHLCRTTSCVRPDHLDVVSLAENIARTTGFRFTHYARGNRTHCKVGHEMTPANSYRRLGRVNSFDCRRCMANYQRSYKARKGAVK